MKKSILLGALALFAISAMSIQNVNAQVKEEKQETKKAVKMAEKEQAPAATMQEPVKEKKGDCCAEKKEAKKDRASPLGSACPHALKVYYPLLAE